MGTVSGYPNGTFAWVDLSTPDAAGARRFYARLFGWDAETLRLDGGDYLMCRVDGQVVAAVRPQRPDEDEPAHWNSYLATDDVDGTTARARELGASVVVEPYDVRGQGRMSLIVDPTGAAVALWQGGEHRGASLVNEPGSLTWNDVITPDPERAARFYGELFGWQAEPTPDGAYTTFTRDDLLIGGAIRLGPERGDVQPAWMPYFVTRNADDTIGAACDEGGDVLVPVREVPAGRIAALRDPAGAAFALFEFNEEGPSRGVDSR